MVGMAYYVNLQTEVKRKVLLDMEYLNFRWTDGFQLVNRKASTALTMPTDLKKNFVSPSSPFLNIKNKKKLEKTLLLSTDKP
ncbi:hypothetical protein BpHYR1_045563 [Brachionus plicatilis]|uniref:Uncharacterized protein n=1 Tax=Brachionus plicatilis TaxID=10195 RepID=A0A3M7QMV5_BRAPC|nr:hypothetical protein BpHYR1_045563 [Brachionus plicatilis]